VTFKGLLFSYRGRISVRRFWLGKALVYGIAFAAFCAIHIVTPPVDPRSFDPNYQGWYSESIMWGALAVLMLISTVMNFAVMVKRCHDRNKSGWYTLIALVPYAGFFWWVIDLGILEGHHGPSQYGPDPQNRPPRAPSAGGFDAGQLRKTGAVLDDGLISQDEYDRKKQQLMGA